MGLKTIPYWDRVLVGQTGARGHGAGTVREMGNIRLYWWLPILLLLGLGDVAALPGDRESLAGYQALAPLFPATVAASWFLAWLSCKLGSRLTHRGLR
jgi:hypothetical protein